MEALYIALLSSNRVIDKIKNMTGINPGYAGQKFNRLIVEGLNKNNVKTKAYSSIPMSRHYSKKTWWNEGVENENGIEYKYFPFINFPVIHQLCLFVFSFIYVLRWGCRNHKEKFILLDVLNISICIGSLLACKLTRVHCVGVVTDMPGLIVGASDATMGSNHGIITKISKTILSSFNSYVFLTMQMNEVINKKNKPYLVMEGMVDYSIGQSVMTEMTLVSNRKVLYAGGLHERYGLRTLVDSFMNLENPEYRLIIYGSGPYAGELKEKSKLDSRIEYRGVAPNEEVMNEEINCALLVNPRPTNEEFTKYSFPSKNMEYMSTGRPLLTTKLPGMPPEYYPYVYLFNDESCSGFEKTMESILTLTDEELTMKGAMAQKWVLHYKNNVVQTAKIIELVNACIFDNNEN